MVMNNLFVFGKTVSGDAFTDREKDEPPALRVRWDTHGTLFH